MQLGISTAGFFGIHETEDAAAVIRELPVDCCEVFLQTASEYTEDFAKEVRERLGRVSCTSVHPQGVQYENQMMSASARQRRDAYAVFEQVLSAMEVLGAGEYVYHGRNSAMLHVLAFDPERNAQTLREMMHRAQAHGVHVAWENVYWCQLTTPERVIEMKKHLPDIHFTLDVKQAWRTGCAPEAFIPAMGRNLRNVHLCDQDEEGRLCLPGKGVFDFHAFFRELGEAGYDGPLILEPYPSMVGSLEELQESLRFLRKQIPG